MSPSLPLLPPRPSQDISDARAGKPRKLATLMGIEGGHVIENDSVAELPRITEALLERGYTPEQVHKILGGNFMRVFREAERVSRELRAAQTGR